MSKRTKAARKAARKRDKAQHRKVLAAREPLIEGMTIDEFIAANADPIWLHQNEMWELIEPDGATRPTELGF